MEYLSKDTIILTLFEGPLLIKLQYNIHSVVKTHIFISIGCLHWTQEWIMLNELPGNVVVPIFKLETTNIQSKSEIRGTKPRSSKRSHTCSALRCSFKRKEKPLTLSILLQSYRITWTYTHGCFPFDWWATGLSLNKGHKKNWFHMQIRKTPKRYWTKYLLLKRNHGPFSLILGSDDTCDLMLPSPSIPLWHHSVPFFLSRVTMT